MFLLGVISTWDLGTVHIQTRLGDARCEQFIGDHLGTVIVDYVDGSADRIPLIYGVTTAAVFSRLEVSRVKNRFFPIPRMSIRLGPFSVDAKRVRVVMDGREISLRPLVSGDSTWVWVRDILERNDIRMTFHVQ